MVSVLTHTPKTVLSYLLAGEDGLSRVGDRLHRAAHERPGGKFGKTEARYLPQTPFPPLLWQPQCGRCRFYEDGAPGEPATCHLVGREGDRWGGEAIHPRGWCAYYLPPEGEPAFEWYRERLNPIGTTSVRGEYRPRLGDRGIVSTPEREREIPVTVERRPVEDGGDRGAGIGSQDGDDGGDDGDR